MTSEDTHWLSIPVRIAPAGSGDAHRDSGVLVRALIDPASQRSVIDEDFLHHELHIVPDDFVVVDNARENLLVPEYPVDITIELKGNSRFKAQISCLGTPTVLGTGLVTIGNDVLSLLGLELHIDYPRKSVRLEKISWEDFENHVAVAFRALGANVKANVNLSGFQIDIFLTESTKSGQTLRTAVECKFFKDKVGNREVNDFARVVAALKSSGDLDRGIVVSYRGFTQDASLVASAAGVDLMTLADLEQRVAESSPKRATPSKKKPVPKKRKEQDSPIVELLTPRKVFVVMPFSGDLQDVYYLGIRDTVSSLSGVCERADEIQHTGGILEKIYASIREADVIVAEVSLPNTNVYYEIGYAHALKKKVVLITRDVSSAPFDLRGYNHVVYGSIVELRKKLMPMLSQLFTT